MNNISRHAQSPWPVNVALIPGNTDNRRLGNLIRAIRELSADESDSDTSQTGNMSLDSSERQQLEPQYDTSFVSEILLSFGGKGPISRIVHSG
ncbi:hypothetical protein ACQKWADRAFT_305608 [Trichoderma austrokoningii]